LRICEFFWSRHFDVAGHVKPRKCGPTSMRAAA
jgi:hypothetical protein